VQKAISTFSKLIIDFSKSWPFVLIGRFLDRFGKGIRLLQEMRLLQKIVMS